MKLSTGARNQANDGGIAAAFDGGTGRLALYSGAPPASADSPATGTLLATLTLPSDVFPASVVGVATANPIAAQNAVATGVPGWARFYRTGDTAPGSAALATDRRADLTVSLVGQGGEAQFNSINFTAGNPVTVTALTITQPAG